MGDPASCPHHGLYWFADPANERGWKCTDCDWRPGEEPGFSPAHDRSHLETKVGCILMTMHEAEVIYVSNGIDGDRLTSLVTKYCSERSLYDSVSIARVILEHEGSDRHARFWRDISEGILAGKDPRTRCACGKLATQWRISAGVSTPACSMEHMKIALDSDDPF